MRKMSASHKIELFLLPKVSETIVLINNIQTFFYK